MHILYLGPENDKMIQFLHAGKCTVKRREDKISLKDLDGIDYIISYGYRHMIDRQTVERFRYRAINLHISYLPWNKGADPNLWSFLEDTPKGVSIHYIDSGLDTGEILLQREIQYDVNDTLKTTYEKLQRAMEKLFIENWEKIKMGNLQGRVQDRSIGSCHRSKDKLMYSDLLTDGWDTSVMRIIGKLKG